MGRDKRRAFIRGGGTARVWSAATLRRVYNSIRVHRRSRTGLSPGTLSVDPFFNRKTRESAQQIDNVSVQEDWVAGQPERREQRGRAG